MPFIAPSAPKCNRCGKVRYTPALHHIKYTESWKMLVSTQSTNPTYVFPPTPALLSLLVSIPCRIGQGEY